MNRPAAAAADAVRIRIPSLVELSRHGPNLPWFGGRIRAQQAGDYRSPFRGRGMEYDESRPYQPGDDIRNIDWRVTARSGRAHTKLFREERERPVLLWVDLRRSMFFATRGAYKSVIAARFASVIAWGAAHQGDRVGGLLFSDCDHVELKPRRGKSAVLQLIRALVAHPAWDAGTTPAIDAEAGNRELQRLTRVARPGSLIFLISDFRRLDDGLGMQVARLSAHNEIVMIFIHDPLERDAPPPGQYRISDGTNEALIDSYDRQRGAAWRRRFETHLQRLRQMAGAHRVRLLIGSTQDDPAAVLRSGLAPFKAAG